MSEIAGDQGGSDYIIPKDVVERLGNLAKFQEIAKGKEQLDRGEGVVRSRSERPHTVALKPEPKPEPTVYYIDDRTGRLDVTPELMAAIAPMLPEHEEGTYWITADADSFIRLLEATGATVKRFAEWGDE